MLYFCNHCGKAIDERLYDFSKDKFGRALCLQHQEATAPQRPRGYFCRDCGQKISYAEFRFSLRDFDKPLCRDCQPEKEERVGAPPQKHGLNSSSRIEIGGTIPKDSVIREGY